MSTTIQGQPLKMKGIFIGSVSLASATRSSSGMFTVDGTISGDLHTSQSLKSFTYRVKNNQEDESASDVFLEDMVNISGGVEGTIVEQRLANFIPLTEQLIFGNYQYVRVQRNYLPPGATVPFIYLAMYSIADFDGGDTSKGIHECTLNLTSCSISPFVLGTTGSLPY